ncbi:MAG TPA: VC0807 family protein [Marmoricola sp.]|nr:VC0807 family protein [Marmoricola sp.]
MIVRPPGVGRTRPPIAVITIAPPVGFARDVRTASSHDRPELGTIVRRVATSLLVACAVPASVFYTVYSFAGIWTAILCALSWSYGAILFRALTGRRASGLLILTAVVMTGRTLISLAAGSTFLYFLQPIISDGVVGATFLLSLATARPVVARLAGDFYPMDHELAMRPRIQRLFRQLTVMWALLCLGKAAMTLWLLRSTSMGTFVVVKPITVLTVNGLAVAATIAAAATVARKEGLLA